MMKLRPLALDVSVRFNASLAASRVSLRVQSHIHVLMSGKGMRHQVWQTAADDCWDETSAEQTATISLNAVQV